MSSASDSNLRVVLDTNVLLSALVFAGGVMGQFRKLWTSQKILPYTSKEAVQELIRVLANPKFKLDSSGQNSLLSRRVAIFSSISISPTEIVVASIDDADVQIGRAHV